MDPKLLSLDEALNQLTLRTGKLSRRQIAALAASCGHALFPLYEYFVDQHGWGNPEVLNSAEMLAMRFAAGGETAADLVQELRMTLEAVVPDGEYFDSPGSTFAQAVTICMDVALCAIDPLAEINPGWVEYALEPVSITAVEEATGFTDLGSGKEAEEWSMTALRHHNVGSAYTAMWDLLELVETRSTFSSIDFVALHSLASGLMPKLRSN